MGINQFWQVVAGAGEKTDLVEMSSRHYQSHGRPLRVTIDTPYWMFHNIDDKKVEEIRKKTPAAKLKERAVLNRIFWLRSRNIEIIFVFDGPKRGMKRGKEAKTLHPDKTIILKEMLRHLGVPYHYAPAEAEAECSKLQKLGIVDAVWSGDSDAFMFGCTILWKFYSDKRGNQSFKSNEAIEKYTSNRNILSREGIVLFALLSGCDYTPDIGVGLQGVGIQKAFPIAKAADASGLARSMCDTFTANGNPIEMNKCEHAFVASSLTWVTPLSKSPTRSQIPALSADVISRSYRRMKY